MSPTTTTPQPPPTPEEELEVEVRELLIDIGKTEGFYAIPIELYQDELTALHS